MVDNRPYWFRLLCGRLALSIHRFAGHILNLAGLPGFVRDCDYQAGIQNTMIKVRVGPAYSILSVDGLDIYFSRLTGKIDGVGSMSSYTLGEAPELTDVRALSGPIPPAPKVDSR